MGIFITASKTGQKHMLKEGARRLILMLCRNRAAFSLFCGIYKLSLYMFTICIRRFCPGCSIYLKSGMAKDEIYPGSSDIDITVVIQDAPVEQKVSKMRGVVRIFRFFKAAFFIFSDMHVFTETEINTYIVSGYGTEEYGKNITPWRLIAGKDRVDFQMIDRCDFKQPFIFLRPIAIYADVLLREYFCGRDGQRYFYRDIYKSLLTIYKYSLFLKGHTTTTFQSYRQIRISAQRFYGEDKRIRDVLSKLAALERQGFFGRFDSVFAEEVITLFLLECDSLFALLDGHRRIRTEEAMVQSTGICLQDEPPPALFSDSELFQYLSGCDGVALLDNAHTGRYVIMAVAALAGQEQRFRKNLKNIRDLYTEYMPRHDSLDGYPLIFDINSVKIFMSINPDLYFSLMRSNKIYPGTAQLKKMLIEAEGLVRGSIVNKIPHWFCRSFIAFREGDLSYLKRNINTIIRMALFMKYGMYIEKDEELLFWSDSKFAAFSDYYRKIVSIDCSNVSSAIYKRAMRDAMGLYYRMLPYLEQELYDTKALRA
ncbi:MAG: hypothetical protein PHR44_00795 [Candidatus Omnitrophica bacterium]|nr:hypothetical protein [Candidatus Omnitrophota bacterium]